MSISKLYTTHPSDFYRHINFLATKVAKKDTLWILGEYLSNMAERWATTSPTPSFGEYPFIYNKLCSLAVDRCAYYSLKSIASTPILRLKWVYKNWFFSYFFARTRGDRNNQCKQSSDPTMYICNHAMWQTTIIWHRHNNIQ